jgi:hypothetical protein
VHWHRRASSIAVITRLARLVSTALGSLVQRASEKRIYVLTLVHFISIRKGNLPAVIKALGARQRI